MDDLEKQAHKKASIEVICIHKDVYTCIYVYIYIITYIII